MHNYTVQSVEHAGRDIVLLNLLAQPGQAPMMFEPGQYAGLSFRLGGRYTPVRCFSMTSSPRDPSVLQFGLRVTGRYTKTVAQLHAGTEVTVQGPYGSMTTDPRRDRALVMIAGGIGITPFMSIIRHTVATGSATPIRLAYASREANPAFTTELLGYEQAHPALKTVFFSEQASTAQPGQRLVTGRITPEHLQQMVGNQAMQVTFMICGPKPLTNAIKKMLQHMNVPDSHVITESFSLETSFAWPQWGSLPAKTYAVAALGMVIATGTVMATDLVKTNNKLNQAKAASATSSTVPQTTTPAETTETSEPESTDTTNDDTTNSTTTTPTSNTTPAPTTTTPTTTPTTPQYTAPVTPPTTTYNPPRGGVS